MLRFSKLDNCLSVAGEGVGFIVMLFTREADEELIQEKRDSLWDVYLLNTYGIPKWKCAAGIWLLYRELRERVLC